MCLRRDDPGLETRLGVGCETGLAQQVHMLTKDADITGSRIEEPQFIANTVVGMFEQHDRIGKTLIQNSISEAIMNL